MLRATEGDAGATASAVDEALARTLAKLAVIDKAAVAPVELAETQRAAGCDDESKSCLSAIAQRVQADAIVVRRLGSASGHVTLALVYFDPAAGEPVRVEQAFEGPDADERAVDAVPPLARRLFGIRESEPMVTAAMPAPLPKPYVLGAGPTSERASQPRTNIRPLTWVTLVAGSGLLAGGLVAGMSAQSDLTDFKRTPVKSMAETLRAGSKFDSVKAKALAADILIPSGALVTALGATLFVLDLTRGEQEGPKLALHPLRGGALLTLQGVSAGM